MRTNQEMLQALEGLLAISSVAGEDVTPEAPYGTGVAKALAYTLRLCGELGMRTVNRDGQTAWAEIGEGDELVAVIPHVDVVPAGDGWTMEPFACTKRDGRLYGRGSSDNKGPAIACVFAAADLLAEQLPLSRRIRLIFGQCEETGQWSDMAYYRRHEEQPCAGFTPDAEFPALCGEKGMLWLELSMPLEHSGLSLLEGGSACNMVASWCRARFRDGSGGDRLVETQGLAAHATVPEQGDSAIRKMVEELSRAGLQNPLISFYNKYIGESCHGEKLGCCFQDDASGTTTLCSGMVRTDGGIIRMTLDIRYPVTADGGLILETVTAAAQAEGLTLDVLKHDKPLYRAPSDPVLQQLLAAYREETGDFSDPLVIGGGTYARALDNIVGFGAAFPGRRHTEHQKDEYILEEDFYKLRSIYRTALKKLLVMDLSI